MTKLPDEDMDEAVRIAQAEFDLHQPQVVVGSSRGGAVAMNIRSRTSLEDGNLGRCPILAWLNLSPLRHFVSQKQHKPLQAAIDSTGSPLRLRVENQLGFKMVKWIQAIEFVESTKTIYQGEGGYNEDHEYFGELANI